MAILLAISDTKHALEDMQNSAEEAAEALRQICMVLDDIALDMSFARHANRMALRMSSDRIANVARTLVGEAQAGGPVGAMHTSIVGKAALAAATISVLPFAEDAGQVATRRFKVSHERAMRNLERVHQHATSAQSEIRKDLRFQVTALTGELDRLAAGVGIEMTKERAELEEAMSTRELPATWAMGGIDQVSAKVSCMEAKRGRTDDGPGRSPGSTSSRLERLAEIEFRIAEIFAQLTGDDQV